MAQINALLPFLLAFVAALSIAFVQCTENQEEASSSSFSSSSSISISGGTTIDSSSGSVSTSGSLSSSGSVSTSGSLSRSNCINTYQSGATLSRTIASDNIQEAKSSSMLNNFHGMKDKLVPWWGDGKRSAYEKYCVTGLKLAIARHRQSSVGSAYSRKKRSAAIAEDIISCTSQGESTAINSHRLCAECHVLTTLDVDRKPRYLNEIKCDTQYTESLSGEGPCVQRTISITIQKDVNGVYVDESYNFAAGCEFHLYPQSALLPLI